MERFDTFATLSNALAAWIGVIGGLATAFAALHAYQSNAEKSVDDRAKLAIEFTLRFQSASFFKIRNSVEEWILCDSNSGTCSARQPQANVIWAFIEFFDSAAYCAERGLCDDSILRQTLGPYATYDMPCLRPHIDHIRQYEIALRPDRPFGFGMDRFSIRDISNKHCRNLRYQ